ALALLRPVAEHDGLAGTKVQRALRPLANARSALEDHLRDHLPLALDDGERRGYGERLRVEQPVHAHRRVVVAPAVVGLDDALAGGRPPPRPVGLPPLEPGRLAHPLP